MEGIVREGSGKGEKGKKEKEKGEGLFSIHQITKGTKLGGRFGDKTVHIECTRM